MFYFITNIGGDIYKLIFFLYHIIFTVLSAKHFFVSFLLIPKKSISSGDFGREIIYITP
jgi:hypothetical protein